jgi:sulfur dioxygenase
VLPAHDYDGRRASTIGRERKNNHRLKLATKPEFVASMSASQLPKPPGMAEVLQTNQQCS